MVLFAATGAPTQAARTRAVPQNIILMISDGMGFNTMLAASYYQHGTASGQVYQHFPVRLAMTSHPAVAEVGSHGQYPCLGRVGYNPAFIWTSIEQPKLCATDSAASATAIASGVKTYNGAVAVDLHGRPASSIFDMAEAVGKATGVVSSMPFSHGTPASFVAHNHHRENYAAIAREMLWESPVEVLMGAGHPWFDNSGGFYMTPKSFEYVGGQASWDRLISGRAPGADADHDGQPDAWTFIQSRREFQALASGPAPHRVVGVAQVYGTLQQKRSGDKQADPFQVPVNRSVPTLAEMSLAALNVLDQDPNGFMVMIEGGAVDQAAHANQPGRLIEEQVDFDRAVKAVAHWVEEHSSWEETLLIVTADHETGFVTGPGPLSQDRPYLPPVINHGEGVMPGIVFHITDHSNLLVPFFARGAGAQGFDSLAEGRDPVYGAYLDNTHIARVVFRILGQVEPAGGLALLPP